ncbi:MAG: NAD-binding protein, partial [Thiohalocapsa sp.]
RDLAIVQSAKRAGRQVYLGNMYSPATQAAAGLGKATAVYVTSHDNQTAKALAVTLHRLYPQLDVYVRLRTLRDQDELVSKGIKHAATSYIESTLARGGQLLKNLGVPEPEVDDVVGTLRKDNYSSVRAAYVDAASS